MTKTIAAALAVLALTGCATQFFGAPHVNGGPRGCWDQCQAWGMDLAGMVKMGEYSDGCICQVRPAPAPDAPQGWTPSSDASPARGAEGGPAVAGVWMQMQAAATAAQVTASQQQAGYPGGSQNRWWGVPGHVGPR